MNSSIKEIITKEGLVLLGIVIVSAIIVFALVVADIAVIGEGEGQKIFTLVVIVALLGYPICLLMRLIIWAIRGLRKK